MGELSTFQKFVPKIMVKSVIVFVPLVMVNYLHEWEKRTALIFHTKSRVTVTLKMRSKQVFIC